MPLSRPFKYKAPLGGLGATDRFELSARGAKETARIFARLGPEAQKRFRKVVLKALRQAQSTAMLLAPERTGELSRSIKRSAHRQLPAGRVFSKIRYSFVQEFGSHKMPAQPYIISAVNAQAGFVRAGLAREWAGAAREAARKSERRAE